MDAPKARDVFQKCVTEASTAGWLDPEWNQTPTGLCSLGPATAFDIVVEEVVDCIVVTLLLLTWIGMVTAPGLSDLSGGK